MNFAYSYLIPFFLFLTAEDDPVIIAAIEQDLEFRTKFGGFDEERRRKEHEEFLRLEGDDSDEDDGNDDEETAAADAEAKRKAQESDDEFAKWEKHQIRKAVSTQKVKQMRQENYAFNNEAPPPETVEDGEEDMDIEIIEEPFELKGGNVPSCSQKSLTEIMEKLRKRVQDKQEFIDSQKSELQRKEANVAENFTLIS
uniref:Uncharacterized protein n=1 Tax=Panagrolaimus sp. PS1159 TaxID=55785 RepID=A0AC35GAY8_9BILA